MSLCAALASAQTFPGAGVDTTPTASLFSVTINGTLYSANVADSATTIGRSAPTAEGIAGPHAVSMAACCTVCQPNADDVDITCWAAGLGGPVGRREVYVEMLCMDMCGPSTTPGGYIVCYLVGQPAYDALNAVGAAAQYKNSFGEVESNDLSGNPAVDFPATSSWAINGVVKITPPPPATSGVFYTTVPILMVQPAIMSFPPPPLDNYSNQLGSMLEGGAGGPCGDLPVQLFDAVGGGAVGQINSNLTHVIGVITTTDTLQTWGLVLLAIAVLVAAFFVLRKRGGVAPRAA